MFCLLPILLVVISAFTAETEINSTGFTYFPKQWSMDGMNAVLRYGAQLRQSYLITILVTVLGTFLGLLIMSMFAYSISRRDFHLKGFLSVYLLIPMLFSGGQLSNYIFFTSYYGLKNTIWVMILPLCVTTMNVIILRTYIHSSIPDELMEAAKIDGAGEYRTFFQITLPLMKPSLAAVGFMMATAYWNDWQNAYLFIDKSSLKPLQLLLINIQKSIETLLNNKNIPSSALQAIADIEGQPDTFARLKALEPYMDKALEAGVKYPFIFAGTPMFYRFFLDKYDFVDNSLNSTLGVDQATNELVNTIQTEDYLNYCKMIAEWGEKGYISVDDEIGGVISSATNQTQDWMFNWWTAVPNNEESEGRDGNQAESFAKVTENWGRSTTTLGSCFAVSATASEEVAKACVEFLGYLFTDKTVADLYTYGIEGEDYVLVDGKIDFNADGITKLYHHDAWCSTSVKPLTLNVTEPDNKVEMYDEFNNAAKGTVASGFRPNKAPVEAQYTACLGVFDEFGKSLELGAYGSADVEAKIAEYQAALDAAGYQEVLAEFQNQYNTWKAAQ